MLIEFWDTDVTVDPSALPGELVFQIGAWEDTPALGSFGVTLVKTAWDEGTQRVVLDEPQDLEAVEQEAGVSYLFHINPPGPVTGEITYYDLSYRVVVPLDTGAHYVWDVTVGLDRRTSTMLTVLGEGAPLWGIEISNGMFEFKVRMSDYEPTSFQGRPPRPEPQSRFDRVGEE